MKMLNNAAEKLDNLAVGASEESAEGAFMNPQKKKRGRPRKSGEEKPSLASTPSISVDPAQAAIETNKQFVGPAIRMLENFAYARVPDERVKLGKDQFEVMVNSGAACIHQYLPDALNKHANLVVFLSTFGVWIITIRSVAFELDRKEKMAETASEHPGLNVPNM
jgi:hypothetical protein